MISPCIPSCRVFVFLFLTGAAWPQTPDRDARWREDIRTVTQRLPRLHKHLYFQIGRAEFEREADALAARVPELDDAALRAGLMQLVARVGDSHTRVMMETAWFRKAPVVLHEFSDGVRVVAATSEHAGLLGARVTGIEGMPLEQVRLRLMRYFPCQNDACVRSQFPGLLAQMDLLYFAGIASRRDRARFHLEDAQGTRLERELEGLPQEGAPEERWRSARDASRPAPLYAERAGQNYFFEYLDGSSTLYVQYRRCRPQPDLPFPEFVGRLMAFADTHPVERLVVDLSRNGGGRQGLIEPLFEALAQRKELTRHGHLFVLIGRETYSAAMQNAITFRQRFRALLVGEPAGHRPNHYGDTASLTLPHSGIEVRYSTKYFRMLPGDPRELQPDVPALRSFADYLAGRFVELEAVLAYRER
jgi:hypothetical protein